jgi:type I restriction-modification system DNA methylase subunit
MLAWKYGTPPVNNANYAWIQHFIHHLAPNGISFAFIPSGWNQKIFHRGRPLKSTQQLIVPE